MMGGRREERERREESEIERAVGECAVCTCVRVCNVYQL